ncbi:MAG TPA: hypothetical protein VJI13_01985 [Candidatus Norongarragalinales archaeon]|nr:hypothetical protein [Candidatus Norongarragalinales archaeon]
MAEEVSRFHQTVKERISRGHITFQNDRIDRFHEKALAASGGHIESPLIGLARKIKFNAAHVDEATGEVRLNGKINVGRLFRKEAGITLASNGREIRIDVDLPNAYQVQGLHISEGKIGTRAEPARTTDRSGKAVRANDAVGRFIEATRIKFIMAAKGALKS